jgi:hypothetical protein
LAQQTQFYLFYKKIKITSILKKIKKLKKLIGFDRVFLQVNLNF